MNSRTLLHFCLLWSLSSSAPYDDDDASDEEDAAISLDSVGEEPDGEADGCTKDMKPVCTTKMETYPNECMAVKAKKEIEKRAAAGEHDGFPR